MRGCVGFDEAEAGEGCGEEKEACEGYDAGAVAVGDGACDCDLLIRVCRGFV